MLKLSPSIFTTDNEGMSCHITVEMYNIPDLNVQIRIILSNTYVSQCSAVDTMCIATTVNNLD